MAIAGRFLYHKVTNTDNNDNNATQLAAVCSMEACVEDLRRWMIKDKLMLNDDKTEFVLIGT